MYLDHIILHSVTYEVVVNY